MKTLAVAITKNRKGKHDGDYFGAEMRAFAKRVTDTQHAPAIRVEYKDAPKWGRRTGLYDVITKVQPETIALFCHGTTRGLPDFGIGLRNVADFAKVIADSRKDDKFVRIVLNACLCGRSRYKYKPSRNTKNRSVPLSEIRNADGFGMVLAAELTKLGIDSEVWCHLTAGNSTSNPMKVRIEGRLLWFKKTLAMVTRTKYWDIGTNRFDYVYE